LPRCFSAVPSLCIVQFAGADLPHRRLYDRGLVSLDGESNWLEGAMLLAVNGILGLAFFPSVELRITIWKNEISPPLSRERL